MYVECNQRSVSNLTFSLTNHFSQVLALENLINSKTKNFLPYTKHFTDHFLFLSLETNPVPTLTPLELFVNFDFKQLYYFSATSVSMSRLLLGLADKIATDGEKSHMDVVSVAKKIATGTDLYFTLGNVSGIYLAYWPTVGGSILKLAQILHHLHEHASGPANSLSDNQLNFLDSLELQIDEDIIVESSTLDLVDDTRHHCLALGFDTNNPSKSDLAKAIIYSHKNSNNIGHQFEPLLRIFNVDNDPEFDQWIKQIFGPFSIAQAAGTTANISLVKFVNLPVEDQFNILSMGFSESNASNWLVKVILPFLGSNMDPLVHWLIQRDKFDQNYQLWRRCIITIVESGGNVEPLVEIYLLAVYYHCITGNQNKRNTMMMYDSIRNTLTIANAILPPGVAAEPLIGEIQDLSESETLYEEFFETHKIIIQDHVFDLNNMVKPSMENCLTIIQSLEVCDKLSATSNITIPEYLSLKYIPNQYSQKQKAILGIMNTVNETTYPIVLNSILLFKNSFVKPEETRNFNHLLLNRFLLANLFNAVEQLYEEGNFLNNDEYFEGVLAKFWDSFNAAQSFDEKSSKDLAQAIQCVPLLESTSNKSLSSQNHEKLVRIKHLLKAISYIKNFKLLHKEPRVVIDKFTPLELVGHILTNNAKLYLAYEKLFKIVSELSLSTSNQIENKNDFVKLLLACIELALLDGNFMFSYKQLIELFNHLKGVELGDTWLTFYQVGNSSMTLELESKSTKEKLDILLKQREVLSLLLTCEIEDNKPVLTSLIRLNNQIKELFEDFSTIQQRNSTDQSLGSKAVDIFQEATHTTHHASEKLSNLFVLGLGWAIGANQ